MHKPFGIYLYRVVSGGRHNVVVRGIAFYEHIFPTDYPDSVSSRQWRHDHATRLIAGYGVIVAMFFDAGFFGSPPWHQRPAAADAESARNPNDPGRN